MTQDLSLALDTGAFFFEQTHRSGATVISETPLDLVRISSSSSSIHFYCQAQHVTLPISTISEIGLEQCSANVLCTSSSCRISIKDPEAHQIEQLTLIASRIQLLLTLSKSSASSSVASSTAHPTSPASSRPPAPNPKYTREAVRESKKNSGNPNDKESSRIHESKNKEEKQAPLLKRHHTNKEVQEIVGYASIAHTFQAAYVLEKIVESEMDRINKEKSGWKVAGAVAGLALGVSDGFQFTDLFTSVAFSNVGGMAHEFASKEQVEFLKKVKSDWLVSQKSALEILHRLGMPRQRSVCYSSHTGKLCIANIHENSSRGMFMVPLGAAKDHATGFKNDDALSVLYNTFDESEINILAYQLYPSELLQLSSQKRISQSKAATLNPYHDMLKQFEDVSLLTLKDDPNPIIAYKVTIPVGSEY